MNILSYRGPSTAGGVSTALARIIETCADGDQRWWYINETSVETRTSAYLPAEDICHIAKETIDGHYRYCNSFIWPVLHDLPEHATLSMRDRRHYRQFNALFARNILRSRKLQSNQCFVNDYQLALATSLIATVPDMETILFWHVPWPQSVTTEHAPYLAEVAQGLLGAKQIGFHTDEYASNFLRFVDNNLPAYHVDFETNCIVSESDSALVTQLVTLPLGLDYRFWLQTAAEASPFHKDLDVRKQITGPFILSVDRADYTKGVLERMDAIDRYFAQNPHRIGEITFVQVCQPTRIGLPAFDTYWQKCRASAEEVNSHWKNERWQPVSWIDKPIPPAVLAWLYGRAQSMLINPVRDGLNLTAKEFAVCSSKGALILSRGAGVWHEIGNTAVPLQSLDPGHMAGQIEASLTMPVEERSLRLQEMKKAIKANTLRVWWRKFEQGANADQTVIPFSRRGRGKASAAKKLLLAK